MRAFLTALALVGGTAVICLAVVALVYFIHWWAIAVVFVGLFVLVWWVEAVR